MSLSEPLLDLLKRQPAPLTAAQAAKLLPGSVRTKTVSAALEDLAQAGHVLSFTQGKAAAYSVHPPLDLCADALAAQVAALTTAAKPEALRRALPRSLQPWFDEALGRLIVQGRAHWLPKGKVRLVQSHRARPSDLLTAAQRQSVQKMLTEANRHRPSPRSLEQFLVWLDGGDEPVAAPAVAKGKARPTAELLRQWYREDRVQSSSSMVPIPDTFRRFESWAANQGQEADEAAFREALQELYDAGKAILEPCERPQDLPEEERRLQVPLTFGPPGYYWSPVE